MSKTKKRRADEEDEARQERILEQLRMSGRMPIPPPGHFHNTGEKQRRRKDRKLEKNRLKNLARNYSRGEYGE